MSPLVACYAAALALGVPYVLWRIRFDVRFRRLRAGSIAAIGAPVHQPAHRR